jgi:hypothetical protein
MNRRVGKRRPRRLNFDRGARSAFATLRRPARIGDPIARFRNRRRGDAGEGEGQGGAWIAHAENADTWRLRRAVFGKG